MTPTLTGVVHGIHYRTDVATTGALAFPASANVLNQLSHAIEWGQASNLMGASHAVRAVAHTPSH